MLCSEAMVSMRSMRLFGVVLLVVLVAAGCSPRLAAFIRGDAAGDDARLQRALMAADDAS